MSADVPARPFLRAEWRYLAMLNYEVAPDLVRRYVPPGTEVDLWNGRTFVSVVGFRFLNTLVMGVPIPFHRHFDEVNLRLYVRRNHQGEWRRGVVFVKEIVPKFMIAWVARTLYNENYVALPMRSQRVVPHAKGEEGSVRYEWQFRGAWQGLTAQITGEPAHAPPEAEETFITEHYWGYVTQKDGSTVEYQVEHPPWRVWRATAATLDVDARLLYGPEFAAVLQGTPSSAFVADGSPVIVRRGRHLV